MAEAPADTEHAVDFALARPGFVSALEKWYIDALLNDGTVVLVYLGRLRLLGTTWARATAEIFHPNGNTVRFSAPVSAIRGGPGALRFGTCAIEGDELHLGVGELRGRLRYRARRAPLAPRDPWLAVGSRKLTWRVEVPDADVEGELTWPQGTLTVRNARGYRDRVFFDLVPWRFPLRRLVWGRAVAGSHAAFWLVAHAATGVPGLAAGEPVRDAWLDGTGVETTADSLPAGVALGPARTLIESHVADLEGLRLGPARTVVRALTGDPHEVKQAAPCAVLGSEGRAIHEIVTWRQP